MDENERMSKWKGINVWMKDRQIYKQTDRQKLKISGDRPRIAQKTVSW